MGVLSSEARNAFSAIVNVLMKKSRHEDFFRPLWEHFASLKSTGILGETKCDRSLILTINDS